VKYGHVETEKLYFSSSEAAEQVGVPVNVLHSWEKDFPELKPKKSGIGKRIYRQSDIEIAKEIKEKASSKEPVRKTARQRAIPALAKETEASNKEFLLEIRNRLRDILDRIKSR